MTLRLGILGTGALAGFLVRRLSQVAVGDIVVSPRNTESAAELARRYAVLIGTDNQDVVDRSDLLIVCLPARLGRDILAGLNFRPDQTVISTMAGVDRGTVSGAVTPATAHVTMMPGWSNALGLGPVLIHPGDAASLSVLEPLGPAIQVEDEERFSAVASFGALSGASYAWMIALIGWFEQHGLSSPQARQLVATTLMGNAAVLLREPDPVGAILAGVATAGGITQHLIRCLQRDAALQSWLDGLGEVHRRITGRGKPGS